VGTVTPNVAEAVNEREVRPSALPHRQSGHRARANRRASFEPTHLKEKSHGPGCRLQKIKPATSKGVFFEEIDVSSPWVRG